MPNNLNLHCVYIFKALTMKGDDSHQYSVNYGAAIDVRLYLTMRHYNTLQDNKIQNRRRQFGNMVISRWPITQARVPLLPKHHLLRQMSIQRSVIDSVINIPNQPIRLLCTHLGHASISERLDQITTLKNIIQTGRSDGGTVTGPSNAYWELFDQPQRVPKTTVLIGDFNFIPSSQEYAALVGTKNPIFGVETLVDGLQDLWTLLHGDEPAVTHIGRNPKQLDYIFATEELASALKQIRVLDEATGSDHKPVMASFEI